MAIEKSDAQVQSLIVEADGSVTAKVNYKLADGSTYITRVSEDVPVTNATTAEKTAAASLVSKAAALAVG
jgi:predicted nuclease with TOPRIM domain